MPCVQLISLTATTTPARFPDFARAILRLSPRTLILDGEVAVSDERVVSRFDLLEDSAPGVVVTPSWRSIACIETVETHASSLGERRHVLERVVA